MPAHFQFIDDALWPTVRYAPGWLKPNHLTMARLLLALLAAVLTLQQFYWQAFTILLLAVLTDVLDGALARKRGLVTYLGIALDPVIDRLLAVSPFIIAWQYLDRRWVVSYLVIEVGIGAVNVWQWWRGKSHGASRTGKMTALYLWLVASGLFLLPKTNVIAALLNQFLLIGVALRLLAWLGYARAIIWPERKPRG